ncbi:MULTISPECIES: hypothetical protein, partial [unclassified Photobacterium]|uniref:hypothetical protein n=1 Tax=unclassified Photobacterium TaxID=2628852 RepID=UPI001EE02F3F
MLTILMFFFVSTCLTTVIVCLLFAGAKTYHDEFSPNDIKLDKQESKYNLITTETQLRLITSLASV